MQDSLSLIVLMKLIAIILFTEKNVRSFCTAKAPHILSAKKKGCVLCIIHIKN